MSKINFEVDQQNSLDASSDSDKRSLAEQVEKLRFLEDDIEKVESKLKKLKKDAEVISGEVIPTMMVEMNIKTIKLADGTGVEVKPVYGASIPSLQ